MDKLIMVFKSSFGRICVALILPMLIVTSCEEQVDDLWNTDDDGQKVSPLVGDWYADSMQIFGECVTDSVFDLMQAKNISDYNLWLLSDGSFQMVVSQSLSIKDECEYVYGTWDSESGCSSSYLITTIIVPSSIAMYTTNLTNIILAQQIAVKM